MPGTSFLDIEQNLLGSQSGRAVAKASDCMKAHLNYVAKNWGREVGGLGKTDVFKNQSVN